VLRDSYVLRTKTRGALTLGLALVETVVEAEQTPRVTHRETTMEYAVERAPSAHARWHARVYLGEIGNANPTEPGAPAMGSGFARACEVPSVPRRVFIDMLEIVRNAVHHVSSLRQTGFQPGCG
jgi:hypothetical protein